MSAPAARVGKSTPTPRESDARPRGRPARRSGAVGRASVAVMPRSRTAAAGSGRSPGRAPHTPRTRGRRVGARSGRARTGGRSRVIASIAAGRSGYAPTPTRAEDRRCRATAVSRTRGHRDREPRDVRLDLVPDRRSAPVRRRRASPDLDAGREHRRGDVPDREGGRLEDRPREVAAAVAQGQPGEHAARVGSQMGDRSPARYGRNTRPSAPGGDGGGLGEQRVRWRSSPPRIASRYQSSARPVAAIARADAVQAGQRRRRHESARAPRPAGPSRRRSRPPRRPGRYASPGSSSRAPW